MVSEWEAKGETEARTKSRGLRQRLFRWSALLTLCVTGFVMAAESFTGFDAASSRGTKLPENFNGFHFDDKTDSSVGWMHLIHLKDGGWITLLFTAANLGPYRLSTSMGAIYLKPGSPTYICSDLWKDEAHFTAPPKDRYWVRVNNSYFGGKYPEYKVKLNDGGCTGDLRFTSIVPSFTQGSGVATFGANKAGKWRLTAISPRAKVTGHIQFKEARVNVEGDAYLEEVATDMMVPTMSDRWYLLRAVNGPYTLNIFDIVVDKKSYGDGHIRTLMLARNDKIIMGTTQFQYTPQGTWTDKATGIAVPKSFKLSGRDGTTSLTGTVNYGKSIHSMNLLEKLPRMARMFAGVVYGEPYQYRAASDYDLIINENGVQTPLKGVGYSEIHFYDR